MDYGGLVSMNMSGVIGVDIAFLMDVIVNAFVINPRVVARGCGYWGKTDRITGRCINPCFHPSLSTAGFPMNET